MPFETVQSLFSQDPKYFEGYKTSRSKIFEEAFKCLNPKGKLRGVYKSLLRDEWARLAEGTFMRVNMYHSQKKGNGFYTEQTAHLYKDKAPGKFMGILQDGKYQKLNEAPKKNECDSDEYFLPYIFKAVFVEGFKESEKVKKTNKDAPSKFDKRYNVDKADIKDAANMFQSYLTLYDKKLKTLPKCPEAFNTHLAKLAETFDKACEEVLKREQATLDKANGIPPQSLSTSNTANESFEVLAASTDSLSTKAYGQWGADFYRAIETFLSNIDGSKEKIAYLAYLFRNNGKEPGLIFKYKALRRSLIQYLIDPTRPKEDFVLRALAAHNEADLVEEYIAEAYVTSSCRASHKFYAVLETLLEKGVDSPYIIDKLCQSQNGYKDNTLFLEKFNGREDSILHLCARYGAPESAKYILARIEKNIGLVVYQKNKAGKTPIQLAADKRHIKTLADIENHGGARISPNDLAGFNSEDMRNLRIARRERSNLNIKDSIKSLVFEGGGVKGNSLTYALRKAIDEGMLDLDKVKAFSGTSAGSINAFLLGAGFEVDDIVKRVETEINFKDLADVNSNIVEKGGFDALQEKLEELGGKIKEAFKYLANAGVFTGLTALSNLAAVYKETLEFIAEVAKKKGACKGEKLRELFKTYLKEKLEALKDELTGGSTHLRDSFQDDSSVKVYTGGPKIIQLLNDVINDKKELTFYDWNQLVKFTQKNNLKPRFKHLRVAAVDTDNQEVRYFSSDSGLKIDEDIVVIDAVRASMSIPGFFEPAVVNGKTYTDGGTVANYPFELAKKGFRAENVLGFKLGLEHSKVMGFKRSDFQPPSKNIDDLDSLSLVTNFLQGDLLPQLLPVLEAQNLQFGVDSQVTGQAIEIDVAEVGTIDFALTDNQKKRQAYAAEYSVCRAKDVFLTRTSFRISDKLKSVLAKFQSAKGGHVELNKSLEGLSLDNVVEIYAKAEEADLPILRRLVNPNIADKNGLTPLHIAMARGYTHTAAMLESAGADSTASTKKGFSANNFKTDPALLDKHHGLSHKASSEKALRMTSSELLLNLNQNSVALMSLQAAQKLTAQKIRELEADLQKQAQEKFAIERALAKERTDKAVLTGQLKGVNDNSNKGSGRVKALEEAVKQANDTHVTSMQALNAENDKLRQANIRLNLKMQQGQESLKQERLALTQRESKLDLNLVKTQKGLMEIREKYQGLKRKNIQNLDKFKKLIKQRDAKIERILRSVKGSIANVDLTDLNPNEKETIQKFGKRKVVQGSIIATIGFLLLSGIVTTAGLIIGGLMAIPLPPLGVFSLLVMTGLISTAICIWGAYHCHVGSSFIQAVQGKNQAQKTWRQRIKENAMGIVSSVAVTRTEGVSSPLAKSSNKDSLSGEFTVEDGASRRDTSLGLSLNLDEHSTSDEGGLDAGSLSQHMVSSEASTYDKSCRLSLSGDEIQDEASTRVATIKPRDTSSFGSTFFSGEPSIKGAKTDEVQSYVSCSQEAAAAHELSATTHSHSFGVA